MALWEADDLAVGGGGVLGMGLAYVCTDLIVALSPESLARVGEAELDMRVLAFTAIVSLVTGVAFGLVHATTS